MPEKEFRKLARKRLIERLAWFMLSLLATLLLVHLSHWAERAGGWEGVTFSAVFYVAAGVTGLIVISSLIPIYSFFRKYKVAIRDCRNGTFTQADFQNIYSDVVGPIPWR